MSVGHGYNGYASGCRCEECRAAKADYMRARRARARALAQTYTVSSTGDRPNGTTATAPGATRNFAHIEHHGTRYGYEEAGCRCNLCTAARTSSDRKYRSGKDQS